MVTPRRFQLLSSRPSSTAATIGLPDEEWGRGVHVVVEPADAADPPSFEDVRAYVTSRLSPYKVPTLIEVVQSIPRSGAMKVNRGRMIEERLPAGLPSTSTRSAVLGSEEG